MIYSDEELKNMSLKDAQTAISNEVYSGSALFELLEGKNKVRGNGHHIRQEMARYAQKLMEERWNDMGICDKQMTGEQNRKINEKIKQRVWEKIRKNWKQCKGK